MPVGEVREEEVGRGGPQRLLAGEAGGDGDGDCVVRARRLDVVHRVAEDVDGAVLARGQQVVASPTAMSSARSSQSSPKTPSSKYCQSP